MLVQLFSFQFFRDVIFFRGPFPGVGGVFGVSDENDDGGERNLFFINVVQCCAEDSVYETPIDPFFVALRVLWVSGDHIKLRQPQQLSHTANIPTPTDAN